MSARRKSPRVAGGGHRGTLGARKDWHGPRSSSCPKPRCAGSGGGRGRPKWLDDVTTFPEFLNPTLAAPHPAGRATQRGADVIMCRDLPLAVPSSSFAAGPAFPSSSTWPRTTGNVAPASLDRFAEGCGKRTSSQSRCRSADRTLGAAATRRLVLVVVEESRSADARALRDQRGRPESSTRHPGDVDLRPAAPL